MAHTKKAAVNAKRYKRLQALLRRPISDNEFKPFSAGEKNWAPEFTQLRAEFLNRPSITEEEFQQFIADSAAFRAEPTETMGKA